MLSKLAADAQREGERIPVATKYAVNARQRIKKVSKLARGTSFAAPTAYAM